MNCRIIISGLVCAAVFHGCVDSVPGTDPDRPGSAGKTEVQFNLSCGASLSMRSIAGIDDSAINSVNIFAYHDGTLEGELYSDGASVDGMSLAAGKTYIFYTLVNVGNLSAPLKESEIRTYRHISRGSADYESCGIPMSSVDSCLIDGNKRTVNIVVDRLVAKVGFRLETDNVAGMEVTSVKLCNVPADIAPFTEASASEGSVPGPAAAPSDIKDINSGGTALFYMLENCQGVLLPDNDDEWQKVPSNLPEAKAELCTYMEVEANLDGSSGLEGRVLYRFYLGQDATSDFNIYRNTENVVTLVATMDGFERISWRIDSSGLGSTILPVVVSGDNGLIAYMDEKTGKFIKKTVGEDLRRWTAIGYGNGRYVAVGAKGSHSYPVSPGYIAVSDDLSDWTVSTFSDKNMSYKDICYGPGGFMALAELAQPSAYIFSSPDGVTWKMKNLISKAGTCIVYGEDYVAMGSSGSISCSSDGISWSNYKDGSKNFMDVCYGDGIYVCIRSSNDPEFGSIGYSDNGYKYTYAALGGIIYSNVAYGKGTFVAIGTYGRLATSLDGIHWNQFTVPEMEEFVSTDICFCDDFFVTVGYNGMIFYSSDGNVWKRLDSGMDEDLHGICPIV